MLFLFKNYLDKIFKKYFKLYYMFARPILFSVTNFLYSIWEKKKNYLGELLLIIY